MIDFPSQRYTIENSKSMRVESECAIPAWKPLQYGNDSDNSSPDGVTQRFLASGGEDTRDMLELIQII
jgi:hypothetical protein